MGVLSALYESKTVKRVNLGNVVKLFGLNDPESDRVWIDFADPGWLGAYASYKRTGKINDKKDIQQEKLKDFNNTNRTLH